MIEIPSGYVEVNKEDIKNPKLVITYFNSLVYKCVPVIGNFSTPYKKE